MTSRDLPKFLILVFLAGCFVQTSHAQVDYKLEASKTDVNKLPYPVDKIVIRGFDAENPPPRMTAPERPLFYGYGMTAYYKNSDSLIFFKILSVEAFHKDANGHDLHTFELHGSRYTDSFKSYFLSAIDPKEKKNLFLRKIYIKDKKGNYLHLEGEQAWCPHCK